MSDTPPRAVAVVVETHEFQWVEKPRRHTKKPDRFVCNKMQSPRRWDAVVFRPTRFPEHIHVDRVIGLPFERIGIRNGTVVIDGNEIEPPERLGPIRYTFGLDDEMKRVGPIELVLGKDEYFLLNDNPHVQWYHRDRGPVSRDQIIAVVDLIYWPPTRWRLNP